MIILAAWFSNDFSQPSQMMATSRCNSFQGLESNTKLLLNYSENLLLTIAR